MTRGLLVELCGLPGAGKSTLCSAVVGRLSGAGTPVSDVGAEIRPDVPAPRRVVRKLGLVAGEAVRGPAWTARLAARMVSAGGPGCVDAGHRLVQWAGTQRLYSRARADAGLHVFDEGAIQALWSLGLRSDVGPMLELLQRHPGRWLGPDLLVVVDEPAELALTRLRARSSRHSRTQLLARADQARELAAGHELLERLVGWYACGSPSRASAVVRVTPSRGLEAACAEVARGVRQLTAA